MTNAQRTKDVPTDSGFVLFETGLDCYVQKVKHERLNFNKRGSNELILRWEKGNGISTWTHGWHQHYAGVQICDIVHRQFAAAGGCRAQDGLLAS